MPAKVLAPLHSSDISTELKAPSFALLRSTERKPSHDPAVRRVVYGCACMWKGTRTCSRLMRAPTPNKNTLS